MFDTFFFRKFNKNMEKKIIFFFFKIDENRERVVQIP
jgi:hypothetical protein